MGKNHGSLARAGKVKAQTPRVECLMSREFKKLTGRAKKRSRYNKRVNSTKKSPNSNSD